MAKLTRRQVAEIVITAHKKNERPDLRRVDLSWVDLSAAYLNGAYLNGSNLSRANLIGADLSEANLIGANLSEANLTEANLGWIYLSWANLSQANLSQANLVGANLRRANLSEANLSGVDLREADLRRAYLLGADLSGVDVKRADLRRADLSEANLSQANLSGVDLSQANLNQADLSEANLSEANLTEANLSEANLSEANLIGANLSRADLGEANLIGANLSRADLDQVNLEQVVVGDTIFGNVDLSVITGLGAVMHQGPSYIDIHTLQSSNGIIPEAFLRGAGVSDTFIAYLASLTGEAIQYCSCFISYSGKDEAFAKRLHTDLQNKGVRCWFAPEELKVGNKTGSTPYPPIGLYDKLLLILSQHSIDSDWVEQEVETALKKETSHLRQTMLFLIRLDSAVMDTDQAWAEEIRRNRQICNFSNWEDHNAYQNAFKQLLHDLTASNTD